MNWAGVKHVAMPILHRFTTCTNGAAIRQREPGVSWSYYRTDPEWGQMRARQLMLELELALAAHDVKVEHLNGMIEIVPKRLHKGVVVKQILRALTDKSDEGGEPDFVLCVGDDTSDEKMFSSIFSFLADGDADGDAAASAAADDDENPREQHVYTVTVGRSRRTRSGSTHHKDVERFGALSDVTTGAR